MPCASFLVIHPVSNNGELIVSPEEYLVGFLAANIRDNVSEEIACSRAHQTPEQKGFGRNFEKEPEDNGKDD